MCELPKERRRPYGGADLICDTDVGSGIQGWLQAPCLALEGSARERHPYNTNFSLRPSLCIILQVAPLNRWVWLDFGPEQVGNGQHLWRIGWDPANYRTLTKRIIELVENSRFYLVEKPAAEIAGLCLADPQVERVTVRVEKPGAHRRRECPAHHPDFDLLRNDLLELRCQWLICLTVR